MPNDQLNSNFSTLWMAFSKDKDRLVFGVYNRIPSFSLFKNGQSGPPAFKLSLNSDSCILLERILNKMLKSSGSFKEAIMNLRYDMETKTSARVAQITFTKDDNNIYYIECISKKLNEPINMQLRSTSTYNTGGDGLSLADKSELQLCSLIKAVHDINFAMWLSPYTPPNKQNGFNKNNNQSGGSNHPSESGGDIFD